MKKVEGIFYKNGKNYCIFRVFFLGSIETLVAIVSFSEWPTLSLLDALFLMIIAAIDNTEKNIKKPIIHHAESDAVITILRRK